MSLLANLISIVGKAKKRVGRGYGSGIGGHTSGRGTKGQNARTGGGVPLWFEGGQLPLIKRLPMTRGKGKLKVVRPVAEVTLGEISKMKADTITLETLKLEKLIDVRFRTAKVIGTGKITRKVTVVGPEIKVSAGAVTAIEAAGGQVKTN